MDQLQGFQVDWLCSQVDTMKLQFAFVRIPAPDFIQVELVHIQSDDSPGNGAIDVVESVSTGYSKHRNGRGATAG